MASTIQWGDTLRVNEGAIDEQHEKLIEVMNTLYQSLHSQTHGEMEKQTLVELIDYTNYHFSAEKKLMEENGYPDKEEHLARHREFVAKLKELCSKHQKENIEVSRDIIAFLTGWIVNHIMEVDKRLGTFLKEKGVA